MLFWVFYVTVIWPAVIFANLMFAKEFLVFHPWILLVSFPFLIYSVLRGLASLMTFYVNYVPWLILGFAGVHAVLRMAMFGGGYVFVFRSFEGAGTAANVALLIVAEIAYVLMAPVLLEMPIILRGRFVARFASADHLEDGEMRR